MVRKMKESVQAQSGQRTRLGLEEQWMTLGESRRLRVLKKDTSSEVTGLVDGSKSTLGRDNP